MELLALIVGILGNVSSIVVFSSPMVTFIKIMKKGDTESFSPVPYVTAMISQVLWVYYGALNPHGLLIVTISAVGIVFELVYLSIFMVLANRQHKIHGLKLISVSIIAFAFLFLGTFFGSKGSRRLYIVGFLCAINSICMYAAPLSIMRKVITTKSVEYMPFFLTLSLLINGTTWSTYAIVVKDLFVLVPNGIGFLFALAQLILYSIYYKHKNNEIKEGDKPMKISSMEEPVKGAKVEHSKNQCDYV